jgi:hypothetical protein
MRIVQQHQHPFAGQLAAIQRGLGLKADRDSLWRHL